MPGVEPTCSCRPTLRVGAPGNRLAVWRQRLICRPPGWTGDASFVSKSSRPDSSHQKRPDFKQQFRNSFRLLQGHRSFRPSFSWSNLSPWTTRTPCLTCVSEGKPLRHLLIVSKKVLFVKCKVLHGTPPSFCEIATTKWRPCQSVPGSRTWPNSFASCRAIHHTHRL